MLVSKIKPCMSQYKLLYGETANGSLKQLSFIWWSFITWITMVILELIHAEILIINLSCKDCLTSLINCLFPDWQLDN